MTSSYSPSSVGPTPYPLSSGRGVIAAAVWGGQWGGHILYLGAKNSG